MIISHLSQQPAIHVSAGFSGAGAITAGDSQSGVETSQDGKSQGHVSSADAANRQLSEKERREVEKLKRRDREVRAHEQAHLAAAGAYAMGGPRYTYQTGPDGKRYAVGGEVPIDVSEVPGNPEATLQKAQTIRRAALAPSNPSSADRAIAAKAAAMAAKARQDLTRDDDAGVRGESGMANEPSPNAQSAKPHSENSSNPLSGKNVKNYASRSYAQSSSSDTYKLDIWA